MHFAVICLCLRVTFKDMPEICAKPVSAIAVAVLFNVSCSMVARERSVTISTVPFQGVIAAIPIAIFAIIAIAILGSTASVWHMINADVAHPKSVKILPVVHVLFINV